MLACATPQNVKTSQVSISFEKQLDFAFKMELRSYDEFLLYEILRCFAQLKLGKL